ncbi:hypothetical protein [Nostoc sp.]
MLGILGNLVINKFIYTPMAKSADVTTKKLISLAPDNWVKWVII